MKKLKSVEAERFIEEIQGLINRGIGRSFSNIATSIGKKSQDFTDMKAGKKDLQREFLDEIAAKYPIDRHYVLTGERKLGLRLEVEPLHLSENPELIGGKEKFIELPDGMISMRVPVVPVKAFAYGYLIGYNDPQFYDDFDMVTIEVTKRHAGHYLAFEVKGDSMTTLEPEHFRESIFDGVKVIGRELPKQQWVSKLHTHRWNSWVIVHKDKGIIIKQIIKQDVEKGMITIHSLNPDKMKYPDEEIFLDDVEQIFNVVKKLDE